MSCRQSGTAPWASTGLKDRMELPQRSLFIINVLKSAVLFVLLLNLDHSPLHTNFNLEGKTDENASEVSV